MNTTLKPLYTFESNSLGYTIFKDGKFFKGAGTSGTKTRTADGRPRHWRWARADSLMFRKQAQRQCDQLNAE